MQIALEARNLVKRYPDVLAVNDVSFAVAEGSCFGLLGPNGAGKTTTVEIIEGVTPATSGEVLYFGEPAGRKFREEAGIQFQSTALQDHVINCSGVIRERLPPGFRDDEAIPHLRAERVDADGSINGQNHTGLQNSGVSCHQLWCFKEAETGRAPAAERVVIPGGLDNLRISGVNGFRRHART